MYRNIYRSPRQQKQAPYAEPWVISTKNNSQFSFKISDLGHPLSNENVMLGCKAIHPLLIECFITFIRCIGIFTGAPDSKNQACYAQPCVVSTKNNSQFSCKISEFGHPLSNENVILRCKEIHPLLLVCFITFIRCLGRIAGASDSIYRHFMLNLVSFLPKTTLNNHAKYQIWGTLSALKMWYSTVKRYIHCCLSVSWPSLDI